MISSMTRVRVYLFIEGKVQGVFFRQTLRNLARSLSLTGWVRNMPDGRIEAVAEGEKEKIEELVSWCHSGPPLAEVSRVQARFEPYLGGYRDYEIIR